MKSELFEAVSNLGILPLISLGDEKAAAPLADALAEGVVTPGFNAELVRHCREKQIPVVPGCVTAAEILSGIDCGLSVFKFFPAESCGGIEALTLLHGPFPGCSFIPTGGMTQDNIGSYLAKPFIAACGGSFMAPAADVVAGCAGAVIDGSTRDSNYLINMNFPTFCRFRNPIEGLGRSVIVDYMIPIYVNGIDGMIRVEPGDFIFGDNDGVVIVPKAETVRVLEQAEA